MNTSLRPKYNDTIQIQANWIKPQMVLVTESGKQRTNEVFIDNTKNTVRVITNEGADILQFTCNDQVSILA